MSDCTPWTDYNVCLSSVFLTICRGTIPPYLAMVSIDCPQQTILQVHSLCLKKRSDFETV